jgi:cytochrome c biogenesis protein CcmG, thiol:disulfide interchange protein DsbE
MDAAVRRRDSTRINYRPQDLLATYMKPDRILHLLIALSIAALGLVISDSLRDKVVKVGDIAPEFNVRTESGLTLTRQNFGGKVLILNFWATWCPPCIEETPSLNALAKEYGPKGVVVLGVSIDKNQEKYKRFLDRFGIRFPMTRDAGHQLADIYGTYQFPETYIIDRNGKVVQKVISNTNWTGPEIKSFLDNLLRS